jgi:hypothetical protein
LLPVAGSDADVARIEHAELIAQRVVARIGFKTDLARTLHGVVSSDGFLVASLAEAVGIVNETYTPPIAVIIKKFPKICYDTQNNYSAIFQPPLAFHYIN